MATAAVTLRFVVLELVESIEGYWCPECALSTANRITLASAVQVGDGPVGPLRLSTGVRCMRGHGWLPDSAASER